MRFFIKNIFLVFLLAITVSAAAQQKEANIWYFGKFLGLDFNSGTAVPLNDGQLNTIEGVATICDVNGALLFYTDGIKVWNRLHQVMPNGTGLFGNPSSSQSAVIVPKIGDPSRYYVFTVDQVSGPLGLNYSVVNMTLDAGNGDVEVKNTPVISNVVEKITAVRHCNNRDVWVVAHGSASDMYYSFLVSPAGVNTTPVISHTGTVLAGVVPPSIIDSTSLGYLKASPDGKRIAAAHWTQNVDVSDFNNVTGVVSNSIGLYVPGDPHYLSYGVEFSPDSKLLYTTVFYVHPLNFQKFNELYQYDVSLPSAAAIRASKQVISSTSDPIQVYAALQIAPDGKMYMAKNVYKHIAAINNPNVYGAGCNYVSNAVSYTLPQQNSTFGLPTFIQSYFYPPDSFTHTVSCLTLTGNFSYTPASNVVSVKWDFDDPASGINNSSVLNNPSHVFTAPGVYNVKLIKFTNCGTDTLRRTVTTDAVDVNLGADTVVCGGTSVLLNASAAGSTNSFLWQDGSTNPTFLATTNGLYWVEGRNATGCVKRDSINVSFKPVPVFNLGTDGAICDKDTLTLNATTAGATSYLWHNGATTPTFKAFQVGLYWCEVNNGGCIFRDSLSITAIKPSPVVNLGPDVTVCEGIPVTLDASYPGSTYLWQNGSTNPVFVANQPGQFHVQLDLNGCKKSDTVIIQHNLKPRFSLGPDQLICQGNTLTLQPSVNPGWQLLWGDGTTGPTHIVTQPGSYTLAATNSCGVTTDEVIVTEGLCTVYIPNGFTPNNDGKNDLFKASGTEAVTVFNLKVFERNGQIVFETNDKNRGWDGTLKGVSMPSAVFVYLLSYKDIYSDKLHIRKGTLVLIR
jgi:gliding motility-associated-like protein